MRALLVNPWITDFSAYDLWSKPLGLLNIAYYLKRLGFKIDFIDCLDRFNPYLLKYLKGSLPKETPFGDGFYYFEEIEKPKVFKDIPRRYKRYGMPPEVFKYLINKKTPPDIILVTSAMTYWYPGVFEAVRILKERFPKIPLVLGGIYARLCFEHAKRNSGADFVYKGKDIAEIISLIGKILGKDFLLPKIKNNRINYSYELYPNLKYITLRTSGGCPFKCSYCGWYLLEDKIWQQDKDEVVQDIENFHRNFGIKNFSFYDDSLLFKSNDHILKILKKIKEKDLKVFFHTPNGLNIRFITKDIAKALKDTGFLNPRLGLETTCLKRQAQTGQKTTNKEFINALRYLEEVGYASWQIGVYIMAGLPGQTMDEVEDTVRFLSCFKVRIYLEEYSPVPGTPDFQRSGLSQDSDPLLHNNSIFPLYQKDSNKLQKIKDFVHSYNRGLRLNEGYQDCLKPSKDKDD